MTGVCGLDVEAEFVAQARPHALILVRREFECAPFDLRVVQPRPVQHPALNVADRLERLRPVDGVVRAGGGLAGACEPDRIDAVALVAPSVMDAEPRTV